MKKRWISRRCCAVCLAGVIMAGLCTPVTPAAAEGSPVLRIGRTEADPASLGEDRIVTIDISLEGNGSGFLAAEFGIIFDSRLSVAEVRTLEAANGCFYTYSSDENHMVWFSGAKAEDALLFSEEQASLFEVDLVLPEELSVGDTFYIDYRWNGLNGAPAFWYVSRGQNVIDDLKANSTVGAVTVPGADAPGFDQSAVVLNQGESCTLTAQNVAGDGIWFSDHPEIASVENGVITAHAPGSCVISAFYADSDALLTCDVTVRSEYRYSILDEGTITITSREQEVVLFYPDAVGTTKWVTTAPGVVTVEDGVLTALSNGTAQIIATNNSVSKMRTVIVQFEDAAELASGDLNGDASIDIADVITVNKFLLGSASLSASQRTAADVFHDEVLDTTDALTLLKYVVEMVEALPVEP